MQTNKLQVGFIGGGRICNIMLQIWQNQNIEFADIKVFDAQTEQSEKLAARYEGVKVADSIADVADKSDVIFIAVHPPEFPGVLNELKNTVSPEIFLISLAPKVTTATIRERLNCKIPVARVIPNSPSVIGKGFNLFSISEEVNDELVRLLKDMFSPLGIFKQTDEKLLESYATITGMGPTFLWYLFNEMYRQALKTGMNEAEAKTAVNEMIKGASETLFESGLTYEQVLDLIPAYPFKKHEASVEAVYAEAITKLYDKLKI